MIVIKIKYAVDQLCTIPQYFYHNNLIQNVDIVKPSLHLRSEGVKSVNISAGPTATIGTQCHDFYLPLFLKVHQAFLCLDSSVCLCVCSPRQILLNTFKESEGGCILHFSIYLFCIWAFDFNFVKNAESSEHSDSKSVQFFFEIFILKASKVIVTTYESSVLICLPDSH